MRSLVLCALVACSSSTPSPAEPGPPPPADAAPEPPAPDPAITAREQAKQSAITTTPYLFRYESKARSETWTLWFGSGVAVLNVDTAGGKVTQYQGSISDGDPRIVDVEGPTAKMKLECKPTTREVDPPCDASAPKPPKKKPPKVKVEAFDCFHADFKEPMPFGKTPGIAYVADGACAGYRAL